MTRFRPKYITFDCYGTLTRFRMGDMAREIFADRIDAERMEQFVRDSEGLSKVAKEIPLVILSNASNDQIQSNVDKLGAPFHKVFTAQQAQAYKPRLQAFEYMLDNLGCGPEDILHVSSSLRYDLMSANDLGVKNKVFVARGHEPSTPYYNYHEIKDIGGLASVVGL